MAYHIRIVITERKMGTKVDVIDRVAETNQREGHTLTDNRMQEIQAIANRILQRNNLRPGFDLAKFLTEHEKFAIGLQRMDPDTTGMLLINPEHTIANTGSNRVILVNESLKTDVDFNYKRRFIVAHEYGHAVLHASGKELYAHRDTSALNDEVDNHWLEQEAEYFARCLLIPADNVIELLSIKGLDNDKSAVVSLVFKVTKKKAVQRLKELQLG